MALVYCRISRDRDLTGLGVERQEKAARELAERRGLEIEGVLVDNDTSAYSGKRRPAYEQLLARVADGSVDAIVAWDPDRLHRSPKELERFIDVIEASATEVLFVTAGPLDLATPAGRMIARQLGAVARYESEHKSERLRAKARQLAEAGRPAGGGDRPFGYEPDFVTIRESEAAEVRAMADHILAGGSLTSLIRDLEARGVKPVRGGRWSNYVVKRILTSPRIAGLRSYQGRVMGPATWPAILEPERAARLRAILFDPSRRSTRAPRRYLLTGGIGRCALCDAALVARPRADGRRCYVCATGPQFSGCGKIRCLAEPLEDLVTRYLFAAAADGLFSAPDGDPAARVIAQLVDTEERKSQLAADFYVSGDLTDAAQFRAASVALEDRIAGLRGDLARHTRRAAAVDLAGNPRTLADRWSGLDTEARVSVVRALVDRVTVGPAVKGRNFFDPDRIAVTFAV
jgi:site-specific DNA recombinase